MEGTAAAALHNGRTDKHQRPYQGSADFSGAVKEWCEARQIPLAKYSLR